MTQEKRLILDYASGLACDASNEFSYEWYEAENGDITINEFFYIGDRMVTVSTVLRFEEAILYFLKKLEELKDDKQEEC